MKQHRLSIIIIQDIGYRYIILSNNEIFILPEDKQKATTKTINIDFAISNSRLLSEIKTEFMLRYTKFYQTKRHYMYSQNYYIIFQFLSQSNCYKIKL